jgi:HKD family nuclease
VESADIVAAPARVLQAIHRQSAPPVPPETGLAAPWLFTAGKGSPALLTELRRELAACDRVDILVSFITHSGVRKLLDVLQAITAVGADGEPRTRIRILTTTYTGATEARALDALAGLPGCEIRVSLDGRRTRLHAKAWLFRRRTGFGSAYVGSANLSGAALMGGLEWTTKFRARPARASSGPAPTSKPCGKTASFSATTRPTGPPQRLREALRRESGDDILARPTFFELAPKAYQQEMLDQLQLERDHGRWRNLVVAATGTGKTVVAAFDYRRLCIQQGGQPRLLFVAHREEILRQALRTYREVLRDHAFGALLAGGMEPESFDHLFATIDSVASRDLLARRGAGHWYAVVVDECHRLAADRFDAFVTQVSPRILLGLTATPERSDGKPILGYFDNRPDGAPAVELRLWHALDQQLLCPFEYYACDDDTDFSSVPWAQPGEAAIDKLVTGNHPRPPGAERMAAPGRRSGAGQGAGVLRVGGPRPLHGRAARPGRHQGRLRGGRHAPDERRRAPERLARGEVAALVTCDLYNEGIDLPMVDTLLLLRPTQSPVLFQQQIGRGLRLAPGKEGCLILDFVGRHRQDFRFDRLLSTLTGLRAGSSSRRWTWASAACRRAATSTCNARPASRCWAAFEGWYSTTGGACAPSCRPTPLRGRSTVRLASFLREQAIELDDLYRNAGRSGWANLKRDAGLLATPAGPEDDYFGRRFGDLLHVDDPARTDLLLKVAEPTASYAPQTASEQRLLQMLAYQVDGQTHQKGSGESFLERLRAQPEHLAELAELGEVLQSKSRLRQRAIPGLEDCPLCLHAAYGVREILTAVGWLSAERRTPSRPACWPCTSARWSCSS